jgi:drug/metabolite transporter (DMT)-like permease
VSARIVFLLVVSVLAFTANPLLARLAIVTREMDALGYTGVRLASGALMLLAIVWWRNRRANGEPLRIAGTWVGAASLFAYAITYSIGFIVIGAGVGSVILFAAVQISILAWAIIKGDRPGPLEWVGLALAFASLCYLVSPGLIAPDPMGSLLMIVSGVAWAAYTLIGRGSRAPVDDLREISFACCRSAFRSSLRDSSCKRRRRLALCTLFAPARSRPGLATQSGMRCCRSSRARARPLCN